MTCCCPINVQKMVCNDIPICYTFLQTFLMHDLHNCTHKNKRNVIWQKFPLAAGALDELKANSAKMHNNRLN